MKFRRFLLAFSTVLVLLALWVVFIEPRLIDEVSLTVEIPHLPPEWDGETIAFISDLQLGMILDNRSTVNRILEKIIQSRPVAVLIGGDFIYHPTEEDDPPIEAMEEYEFEDRIETLEIINDVSTILSPLTQSRIPVYAVLGNHDYAMEKSDALKLEWVAQELRNSLEAIGITVLHNQSVAMPAQGTPLQGRNQDLHLVGIGPYYPNEGNVEAAFRGIAPDIPRVVMLHNPETFPKIPAEQAPFAISGHTHGGQIRIPWLESWSWLSIVRKGEIHGDGWINDFGQKGNRLYVNKGIGFSILPVRLNCPPELTWITLVPQVTES